MVISIIIGLYLIYVWKKFNDEVYSEAVGTPAEVHFQSISPNKYLVGQIIIIAVVILWLNIIGAIILLLVTPYIQKLSRDKMAVILKDFKKPETEIVNFDD